MQTTTAQPAAAAVLAAPSAPERPPRSETGVLGWLRQNLFSSWGNTLVTIVVAYIVWKLGDGVLRWAVFDAVWIGDSGQSCRGEGSGACWAFVSAKFSQFVYGRYPIDERWRVDLVFALAIAGLVPLGVPQIPGKVYSAVYTFYVFPVIAFWLLVGGSTVRGAGLADAIGLLLTCLLYTSPSPRDGLLSRMPSSA